jgi:hypothetical protein
MRKICAGIGAALLLGCSCGKDATFENAKVHKCNLEKYVAAAKAAPNDTGAMDKVTQTTMLLDAIVERAPDPGAMRAKLAAYACSQ